MLCGAGVVEPMTEDSLTVGDAPVAVDDATGWEPMADVAAEPVEVKPLTTEPVMEPVTELVLIALGPALPEETTLWEAVELIKGIMPVAELDIVAVEPDTLTAVPIVEDVPYAVDAPVAVEDAIDDVTDAIEALPVACDDVPEAIDDAPEVRDETADSTLDLTEAIEVTEGIWEPDRVDVMDPTIEESATLEGELTVPVGTLERIEDNTDDTLGSIPEVMEGFDEARMLEGAEVTDPTIDDSGIVG